MKREKKEEFLEKSFLRSFFPIDLAKLIRSREFAAPPSPRFPAPEGRPPTTLSPSFFFFLVFFFFFARASPRFTRNNDPITQLTGIYVYSP